MISKRFLVPVLALMGWGLPVGASVVSYCSGNLSNCSDPASAFSSASGMVYTVDLTALYSVPNGGLEDPVSGLIVYDYPDQSGSNISESGGAVTDTSQGIQIELPSDTLVFAFDLTLPGGANDATYTVAVSGASGVSISNDGSSPSSFFFGVISSTALTSIVVQGPVGKGVQISEVELAGDTGGGGGGGGSETPEVATFLLIGFGLIAMRWMHRLPRRFLPRRLQPA
jgi:hypothetical protein